MAAPASAEAIRDVNTRYHDAAAEHYDTKWGVDYGEIGRNQVRGKLHKLLGTPLPTFGRSLEIGAGTGYFTLNMLQDGVVREAVASDISPGMLDALQANAQRIGVAVETVACDAEDLPFDDDCFDLVLGQRSCTTSPTSTARSPSSGACCAPAGSSSSPASRRRPATGSPPTPSARRSPRRRCGARSCARGRSTGTTAPSRPAAGIPTSTTASTASRSRRSSTCTPSRPRRSRRGRAARASRTSACAAKSCSPTGLAG